MMIVVIPFCKSDEHLVIKNLELCRMLDGQYDRECLVCCDSKTDDTQVSNAATGLFKKVHKLKYDAWAGEMTKPVPQNWAWQSAARHIYKHFNPSLSWLWWEPDAVPVATGWLDTLESFHKRGGRMFGGAIIRPNNHLSSVAIYPANVPKLAPPAMIVRRQPFEQLLNDAIMRYVDAMDDLIQCVPTPVMFHDIRMMKKTVMPTTVLFHPCRDGSLQDRMMEQLDPARMRARSPDAPNNTSFRLSGPFGDLIYSLAIIKAMGGGYLAVGNAPGPRVKMTRELYDVIAPLIELQPYIRGIDFDPNAIVDVDLDGFRPILREDSYHFGKTIMACMAQTAGIACPPDSDPWLTVDHKIVVDDKPVVINRTTRYRNHKFPWHAVASKYRSQSIFLGTQQEHELMKMQFDWPELKRLPTTSMLDAARVVAGCELYIGNQSSLYAVAEGLKKNAIQEVFWHHADCLFHRSGVTHGWNEDVYLPDL